MSQFETRRAKPRVLAPFRGQFFDLDFDLDKDPWASKSGVSVQRTLNGTVETQPTPTFDNLRATLEGVTAEEKDKWDQLYDQSLDQGEPVEFYADASKVFHLAAMEERCVRTHRYASGTWTRCSYAGQFGKGGLGIFSKNPGTLAKTNYVPNGDFKDGTTGWTASTADISISAQQYLPPSGKLSYCLRTAAANTTGAGTVYVDCELEDQIDNIAYITISFLIRGDRHPSAGIANPIALKVRPADGSGNLVTVSQVSYNSGWTRNFYTQALTGPIGSTTDQTLRVSFVFTDDLRFAPVYLSEVQVEVRRFATGFVPYSTVRTLATGSRAADESLRFTNPIQYVLQQPSQQGVGQFSWTIAGWFQSFWAEGSGVAPGATMHLVSCGIQGSTDYIPIEILIDQNGFVYGQVRPDNGAGATPIFCTSANLAISMGTLVHFALSYQDMDINLNANTGKLSLYINGVLAETKSHSAFMAGAGTTLFLGSQPDLTNVLNGVIHDLTIDGVYIDGTTYTISDFYSATVPPHRERTGWRCVMPPGHDRPCKLKDNLYGLDLQLLETRML